MGRFARDVQEMTPADEWVYEAVVEADTWGDHLPTETELDDKLPLERGEVGASIAHLSTAGLVEPVHAKGETRYRPVTAP